MIEQLNIHVRFLDISLPKGYNQAKTYKQDVGVSREGPILLVKYLTYTFVFKLF